MRVLLPSFSAMLTDLKEGCSGEVRENYELMYKRSIEELLVNGIEDNTPRILRNADVVKINSAHNNCYLARVKNFPHPVSDLEWSNDILTRCRNEIGRNRCYGKPLIDQFSLRSRSHQNNSNLEIEWIVITDTDKSYVNNIFKSFNKVFSEEMARRRLLVAMLAHNLRICFVHQAPNSISKDDVIKCASQYPQLFTTGRIVASYLSTNC